MSNFHFFYGGESPFSNFHIGQPIEYQGMTFPTSEHLFMVLKALHFNDMDIAQRMLKVQEPWRVKRLGRQVQGFNKDEWDGLPSYNAMLTTCLVKFTQDPKLQEFILSTDGQELVEASPRDFIWGIGMDVDNPLIWDRNNWRGENKLGKVLMHVRDLIKNGITNPEDVWG